MHQGVVEHRVASGDIEPLAMVPWASSWVDGVSTGLFFYLSTSLVVIAGIMGGWAYNSRVGSNHGPNGYLLDAFSRWDAKTYVEIATCGYSYDSKSASSVAFFPAYPVLGSVIRSLTGLHIHSALLLLSHLSLAGTFILFAVYLKARPQTASTGRGGLVLLSFGLLPTTVFFRVCYSESLFAFFLLLALCGMQRRWSLWAISAAIGFATATRPVGVALLVPLALDIMVRVQNWRWRIVYSVFFGLLSCWGLLAFMGYQAIMFDDPLAFAKTQEHYRMQPPTTGQEKWTSLATFDSVVSNWMPSCACYWRRLDNLYPAFSLVFTNSIWWLSSVGLMLFGARKKWLNAQELSLGLVLLVIPYLTRGYEMCMGSMGRYAAAALPIYIVLGRILYGLPVEARWLYFGASAFFLIAYSALFGYGQLIF